MKSATSRLPAGLNRVFYSDNGSTAVEAALKIAYQYYRQRPHQPESRELFVSFSGAYHGDTVEICAALPHNCADHIAFSPPFSMGGRDLFVYSASDRDVAGTTGLDVIADIARFGERGGVGHGERHVEDAGQRLGEQRLAATRRSDQHDVRLGDLDLVALPAVAEALVVIVHRNSENALGLVLADHVVVENLADFLGRRHAVLGLHQGGLALLPDDVHAEFNAFIADEHCRTGNELTNLVLALTAEAAIQRIAGIAPGLGGWHVSNAPPLGGPADLRARTQDYVNRGLGTATTSKCSVSATL